MEIHTNIEVGVAKKFSISIFFYEKGKRECKRDRKKGKKEIEILVSKK